MTNKEKAVGYMKDVGIFDDVIKAFETDDIVFFSINGFIYSLTPQMRQTISEIENKLHSDAVIWHVIHGKYKMCDGSELRIYWRHLSVPTRWISARTKAIMRSLL